MSPIAPPTSLPDPVSTGSNNSSSTSNSNSELTNADIDPNKSYFGHDSKEVTRLIIQALGDLGYPQVAENLIEASGYNIESPQVKEFREAILAGAWNDAEALLDGLELYDVSGSLPGQLQFDMRFLIRRQDYLEKLEAGDSEAALHCLRHNLTPLGCSKQELRRLSELAVITSPEELRETINWNGVNSRTELLKSMEKYFSPSIMIPSNRLATLLDRALQYQVLSANYYIPGESKDGSLCEDYVDRRENFPRIATHCLSMHSDEVWHVSFSHDGKRLVTASKDSTVIIWNVDNILNMDANDEDGTIVLKGHKKGVLCAEWSPDDHYILTSSADNTVNLWNSAYGKLVKSFSEHTDVVGSIGWLPDSLHFITGSPDKSLILWNIYGDEEYRWEFARIMNLAISPNGKEMVVLCHGDIIYVYSLETMQQISCVSVEKFISCVTISKDSKYALINAAKDEVLLFELSTMRIVRKFVGQYQTEFMIRSCFGGPDENFILSGSEDENIYVWNRNNSNLIEVLSGHTAAVNCIKWRPTGKPMFASASDDGTVRIWESSWS